MRNSLTHWFLTSLGALGRKNPILLAVCFRIWGFHIGYSYFGGGGGGLGGRWQCYWLWWLMLWVCVWPHFGICRSGGSLPFLRLWALQQGQLPWHLCFVSCPSIDTVSETLVWPSFDFQSYCFSSYKLDCQVIWQSLARFSIWRWWRVPSFDYCSLCLSWTDWILYLILLLTAVEFRCLVVWLLSSSFRRKCITAFNSVALFHWPQ